MLDAMDEARIRERFDAGDLRAAATLTIDAYGGEICSYLAAVLRDDDLARDVFADAAVELWKDLPKFRWQSTLRTWFYAVARHRMYARLEQRKRRPASPLSQAPEIAAQVRTTTAAWRRTDVKEEVARARASLTPDEQSLLILRVDRQMSWREVAAVLDESSEPALRKRFERIKEKLRAALRGAK